MAGAGIVCVGVDDEGWGCLCWDRLIELKRGNDL